MKNLFLIISLLITLIQKSNSQGFEKFKSEYVLKNYGEDSLKINQTIVLKKTVSTEMFLEGSTPKLVSKYDSVVQIEVLPFYYRREAFSKKNADCLCQQNGVDYIRNQMTNSEYQELNEFRNNAHKPQLDVLFFDPIIGWQGISDQKPSIKDTIIDNKPFIKIGLVSRNSKQYVHFIEKDSYHLLKTLIIDHNGKLNQEITRQFFKKNGNVTYPSEIIIDMYISQQAVRLHETVESIVFYKNKPNEGTFNCKLPYDKIIFHE
jgi:hypothetical protein